MVPGSTFRYGSNFIRLTFNPRLSSRHPIEAAASPLPREDTTPPVTKMYFAGICSSLQIVVENLCRWGARSIMAEMPVERNGRVCGQLFSLPAPFFPPHLGHPLPRVHGAAALRRTAVAGGGIFVIVEVVIP